MRPWTARCSGQGQGAACDRGLDRASVRAGRPQPWWASGTAPWNKPAGRPGQLPASALLGEGPREQSARGQRGRPAEADAGAGQAQCADGRREPAILRPQPRPVSRAAVPWGAAGSRCRGLGVQGGLWPRVCCSIRKAKRDVRCRPRLPGKGAGGTCRRRARGIWGPRPPSSQRPPDCALRASVHGGLRWPWLSGRPVGREHSVPPGPGRVVAWPVSGGHEPAGPAALVLGEASSKKM